MNLDEAFDALLEAGKAHVKVGGKPLQSTDDYGVNWMAPFYVVGPPSLAWDQEGFCLGGPSSAEFPVVLVLDENQFTTRDAPRLAVALARAIELDVQDAVVSAARPVAFTGGGTGERPGYEIIVSMIITDG